MVQPTWEPSRSLRLGKAAGLIDLSILFFLLLPFLNPFGHLTVTVASKHYQATMSEWTIPTPASGVKALTLDQSGSCCWFVEYYTNKVGHFDPTTNTFKEWPIPSAGANPYDIAIVSNSASPSLWGTEFGTDRIFAFSPATDTFQEYSLPHANTGVGYISVEPAGLQVRVWFTETIKNVNGELIYDPTSGNATLYEDYFPLATGGGAYGVYAQSNSVWFAGFSALVRWDRATQQYSVWPLPDHGSAIGRSITVDPYGQAWYTQGTQNATSEDNFVGVLSSNSIIEEWKLASPGADPWRININQQSLQPWVAERSLGAGNGAVAVLANSSAANLVPTTPAIFPSGGTPTVLASESRIVSPTTSSIAPVTKVVPAVSGNQFREFPDGTGAPQDTVIDSRSNVWLSEPGTNKIAEISSLTQDFALSGAPPAISLAQAGSGLVSIVGSPVSGYHGIVSINALNIPQAMTIAPEASALNIPPGGENASIEFMINAGSNATPGSRTLAFEGNDGTFTHTTTILVTIANNSLGTIGKSKCLIATATDDSYLSGEVGLLRSFRDNILGTKTGSSFLAVFNSWYYSFSPKLSSYMSTDARTREVVRGALYPLLGALALSSIAYQALLPYHESAALVSGLVASCLIGCLYIGLPLGVMKRKFGIRLRLSQWLCFFSFLGGLGWLLVGLNLGSDDLLMVGSSATVLFTVWGSGLLTAEFIAYLKPVEKPTPMTTRV